MLLLCQDVECSLAPCLVCFFSRLPVIGPIMWRGLCSSSYCSPQSLSQGRRQKIDTPTGKAETDTIKTLQCTGKIKKPIKFALAEFREEQKKILSYMLRSLLLGIKHNSMYQGKDQDIHMEQMGMCKLRPAKFLCCAYP